MSRLASVMGAIVAIAAISNSDAAPNKPGSFEECQRLAIARGIEARGAHANRYEMLKGSGQRTKPRGFMARCMAGETI